MNEHLLRLEREANDLAARVARLEIALAKLAVDHPKLQPYLQAKAA